MIRRGSKRVFSTKTYINDVYAAFATQSPLGPIVAKSEFVTLLPALGILRHSSTLEKEFDCVDTDADGKINEAEFFQSVSNLLGAKLTTEDLITIWKTLDKEEKGQINQETFLAALSVLNAADFTLQSAKTENKTINFDQFQRYVSETSQNGLRVLTGLDTIFTLGGPGCGKGTRAKLLKKACGASLDSVSSGDLLRDQVANNTSLAQKLDLQGTMQKGQLVSSQTVTILLQAYLARQKKGAVTILDGFPRSVDNVEDFVGAVGMPDFVLDFKCPDDLMISRISNRAATEPGRADDSFEIAKQRVQVYHDNYNKVMESLKQLNMKVYTVDTSIEAEDNVAQMLEEIPVFKKLASLNS